jgi:hypothetical protein
MTLEIGKAVHLMLIAGHDFVRFSRLDGEIDTLTPRQAALLVTRRLCRITGTNQRVKKITELPTPDHWQPCWRNTQSATLYPSESYAR